MAYLSTYTILGAGGSSISLALDGLPSLFNLPFTGFADFVFFSGFSGFAGYFSFSLRIDYIEALSGSSAFFFSLILARSTSVAKCYKILFFISKSLVLNSLASLYSPASLFRSFGTRTLPNTLVHEIKLSRFKKGFAKPFDLNLKEFRDSLASG